jgi:glycosyltransferase involved in cell wall biosynthesis
MQAAGFETAVIDQGRHPTTQQQVGQVLAELGRSPPDLFVPDALIPALFAGRWVRAAGIPTVGVMRSDNDVCWSLMAQFVFGPQQFRLSGLVCVSETLEREVLKRTPLDTIVTRIPSGAPVPGQAATPPDGTLRLIYLGRLEEEQKRISELARALCRAAREVPGVEADIFGGGTARTAVENILAAQGKDLPVRLHPAVEPDEVARELLSRHVFVLMSDYEGTPVAVMEAMAAGVVPICLWTRSGIPELVEDGVTGLIVQNRGDDFIRALRRIRTDPTLWGRLAEAARARIVQAYSCEVVAKRWVGFLHNIASTASHKSTIQLPRMIRLPSVRPALAPFDVRRGLGVIRRCRRFAGRIKRACLRWTFI